MKITLRNTSIGLAAFANSSVEAPPEVAPSLVDAVSDPGYGAAAGSPSAPPNPEISKKPKPKKRPRCSVAVEPVSPPTYAKAKLEVKSEAHAPSHGHNLGGGPCTPQVLVGGYASSSWSLRKF